jgi:hypothetical protein
MRKRLLKYYYYLRGGAVSRRESVDEYGSRRNRTSDVLDLRASGPVCQ